MCRRKTIGVGVSLALAASVLATCPYLASAGTIFDEGNAVMKALPAGAGGADLRPVPDPASRATSRKSLELAYAQQLADRSCEAERRLSQSLLTEAKKTEDSSSDQFTLFLGAIGSAEQAHSVRLAFAAIDAMADTFAVDRAAMKTRAAVKACSLEPGRASWSIANAENLLELMDQLMSNDDVSLEKELAPLLRRGMTAAPDKDLQGEINTELQIDAEIQRCRAGLVPSLKTLRDSPDNPAANLEVGSYLCFLCGQWQKGLPLLAKSSDAKLSRLAGDELALPTRGEDLVKLADEWVDAASKISVARRVRIIQHAAGLYEAALASLSDLQDKAIEAKLAELRPYLRLRRIDLLDRFDPDTDIIRGNWHEQDGTLFVHSTPTNGNQIDFPYQPPKEYDLIVSFSTIGKPIGDACVVDVACVDRQQFCYFLGGWGNKVAGFEMVNGEGADRNKSTVRKNAWLEPSRHYISALKVREDGFEADLDGHLVTSLKTDGMHLTLFGIWRLSRTDNIGLGIGPDAIRVDQIEVVEITGRGKDLNR